MKIFGLALLFSAFLYSGFFIGSRYISALKEIERSGNLLKNIIFCLKKENMTVSKIFETCSLESDGETKNFILSLSPKNFDNIEILSAKTNFCKVKSANRILQEAFSVLGKYSADEQLSEIEFCRKKLINLYEKSEEPFKSKAKLFRYFGILAGAFFVIIFI
ncbi:MAG: stage III sporulation protein AB [Oscillospiraceae bacterium]|nr:stage III sporulation protein AB [Oscillospiraceae bacterium]